MQSATKLAAQHLDTCATAGQFDENTRLAISRVLTEFQVMDDKLITFADIQRQLGESRTMVLQQGEKIAKLEQELIHLREQGGRLKAEADVSNKLLDKFFDRVMREKGYRD